MSLEMRAKARTLLGDQRCMSAMLRSIWSALIRAKAVGRSDKHTGFPENVLINRQARDQQLAV